MRLVTIAGCPSVHTTNARLPSPSTSASPSSRPAIFLFLLLVLSVDHRLAATGYGRATVQPQQPHMNVAVPATLCAYLAPHWPLGRVFFCAQAGNSRAWSWSPGPSEP